MKWWTRGAVGAVLLGAAAGRAGAQQAAGDSAWIAGDFHRARINYEQVLAADPASVRANYRLGILASWDGQLDSALVLIRRARLAEPLDPDIRATEARVLSWAGRTDEAIALYDSILVDHPRHADALTGLGQVYLWDGQYSRAAVYAGRALAIDPANRTAQDLDRSLRAAVRPQPELTLGWSNDSDDNTSWWQTLAASYLVADAIRLFGSIGALEASDPFRDASRLSAEAGARYGRGNLHATAALGASRLSPESGPSRTAGTFRGSAGYRLGSAGIGAGYAHYPFDETALLIGRDLDVDAFELEGDARLRPGLTLGAGAGYASLSDDNSRRSGILTLTQVLKRDFFVGVMARALGYDFKGVGYFSPDWFSVYEARAGYAREVRPWSGRLSGGLGVQQVGSGGKVQSEWHLEGRLGRSWGTLNVVEIFAGISNSAESSTTGAFRYRTAGVMVRIGL
jgi:tetratricopeptide (TPR) repeat protein